MLISRPYKKFVSLKLIALSFLILPMALLFLSVIVFQVDFQGEIGQGKGVFVCSAYHGGGPSSGCSLYEAVFEGAIAAAIFSYATFGLMPLAVFLSSLSILVLMKRLLNPGAYRRGRLQG
jgi:hypothetical protein